MDERIYEWTEDEKKYILKNEGEKTNASENISNKKESCHIIYSYVIATHL